MPAARFLTAAALLAAPALFVGCAEDDDADVIAPAPAADADMNADVDVDADGDMDTGMDGGLDDTRPSNELDDM